MNKDIDIYVDDTLINHKSVLNEMDSKKIHMDEKIPKSMIIVESLPRNAMGKVTKPVLKEML